jgi:hypothetical protein
VEGMIAQNSLKKFILLQMKINLKSLSLGQISPGAGQWAGRRG